MRSAIRNRLYIRIARAAIAGGANCVKSCSVSAGIAETPRPNDELGRGLERAGVDLFQIGDCVAPRRASLAFYEGRSLAMGL